MEPTSVTKAMIRIVSVDRSDRPHYLAIYGGKLTTYRAIAERMMRCCPCFLGEAASRTPATSPFDGDAQFVDHPVDWPSALNIIVVTRRAT